MITTIDRKDARNMSIEDALMILRRKPQSAVEYKVCRTALLACQGIGMDQAEIEREAMRGLSYPEELYLAEFEEWECN